MELDPIEDTLYLSWSDDPKIITDDNELFEISRKINEIESRRGLLDLDDRQYIKSLDTIKNIYTGMMYRLYDGYPKTKSAKNLF